LSLLVECLPLLTHCLPLLADGLPLLHNPAERTFSCHWTAAL